MRINDESMKLILRFEVGGGKEYYDRFLKSPTWPGAYSGVTIGVGYDLGYNLAHTVQADWQEHLSSETIGRLTVCCGKKGKEALKVLSKVKDIIISWTGAFTVFEDVSISKYWKSTCSVFKGVEDVHPNCQGALLSLVFNRGTSLKGERRKEMLEISKLVKEKKYKEIAQQIRSMKRLWRGTDIERGMSARRDAEADLVISSL